MTLLVLFGSGFASLAVAPATPAVGSARGNAQGLSSDAQAWLRATIHEGKFSELRWPDFSDYRGHLDNFYELNSYSLWWVRGQEPTTQARQMILLLLQSDQKGLSPDDYDGPRWQERLAGLRPAVQQPTQLDKVKFDLALTVCAMRYISDLHIGKVNPKRVAFFLKDESKKYDLAEFLRDHVVNATDVSATLAQVEPPYPGYRRTLQACNNILSLRNKMMGSNFRP